MHKQAQRINHRLRMGVDRAMQHTPAGARRKYRAEMQHWRDELAHLNDWFTEGTRDWWGIPAPTAEQKAASSGVWSADAILTMHALRPSYHEELQLRPDALAGERVLEVGCGPLAPVLSFDHCERHGLDPLIDQYTAAGWPLYALDTTFVNAGAERMPYPDSYFDTVISVNALDHVDDFEQSASEIQRVLKPGGRIMFEVEYHEPTITEPLKLDDSRIAQAFHGVSMSKVREVSAHELFANLVTRYGLNSDVMPNLGSCEQYALWHGTAC